MDQLYWIALILFVLVFLNRCKEKFTSCSRRQQEGFQDSSQLAEMAKNDTLFQYTYGPVGRMTRGVAPASCSCSREQLAKGDCPHACSMNRRREPLNSMEYNSL
jgi:hypothetical protein